MTSFRTCFFPSLLQVREHVHAFFPHLRMTKYFAFFVNDRRTKKERRQKKTNCFVDDASTFLRAHAFAKYIILSFFSASVKRVKGKKKTITHR